MNLLNTNKDPNKDWHFPIIGYQVPLTSLTVYQAYYPQLFAQVYFHVPQSKKRHCLRPPINLDKVNDAKLNMKFYTGRYRYRNFNKIACHSFWRDYYASKISIT